LELKNIYDFYPELKIVITGSSALSFFIHSADLGRRASVYDLPELSFREYLYFVEGVLFETINLSDIINNHENLALSINSKIKSVKLFREYLRMGAYPYVLSNRTKYFEKVEATINTVIGNDIPAIENISYESGVKMKKFLLMMATSSPFKINISELSRKMETSRDILTKHLNLLSQAGIIKLLTTEGIEYQIIRKPDKVYFSNSNLMYAINEKPDIGTVRETFFLNQLSTLYKVNYSKSTDFMVDEKYLFEIGGKNKTNKQIKDMPEAYLAIDDTEYGYKNKIPLWLFGFLY
jgi:DNA-binding transcriptional ArsR family regulator